MRNNPRIIFFIAAPSQCRPFPNCEYPAACATWRCGTSIKCGWLQDRTCHNSAAYAGFMHRTSAITIGPRQVALHVAADAVLK